MAADPSCAAGGPVMAARTLAVIRKIMNWHATRSDDFRSPIVKGMGRVRIKERARSRVLDDDVPRERLRVLHVALCFERAVFADHARLDERRVDAVRARRLRPG